MRNLRSIALRAAFCAQGKGMGRPTGIETKFLELVPPIGLSILVVVNTYVLSLFIDMSRLVTIYVFTIDFIIAIAVILAVAARLSRHRFIGLVTIWWLLAIPIQIIAIEAGMFYWATYLRSTDDDTREGDSLWIDDEQLGWTLRPGATVRHRSTGNFDVTYHIDRDGRRDQHGRVGATGRVHFFGDSFTFGAGVEDRETYAAILQDEHLASLQVVNHGVSAYGLEQMYVQLTRVESAIHPDDIVVFAPISEDLTRGIVDPRFLCRLSVGRSKPINVPVLDDGKIRTVEVMGSCGILDIFFGWARLPISYLGGRILDYVRHEALIENANQVIELAVRTVRERDASFMLVFLARPHECWYRRHAFDLSGIGWPYRSLLADCPTDPAVITALRFPYDGHWSHAGHQWAAAALAKLMPAGSNEAGQSGEDLDQTEKQ